MKGRRLSVPYHPARLDPDDEPRLDPDDEPGLGAAERIRRGVPAAIIAVDIADRYAAHYRQQIEALRARRAAA